MPSGSLAWPIAASKNRPNVSAARFCRADQAARMPGLRHALHAGASAGRDDGFVRRRLRGLLPLSPARVASGGMKSEIQLMKGPYSRMFHAHLPVPLQHYPQVLLAHGGGGKLMHQLIGKLFLPAFRNPTARSRSTTRACSRSPGSGSRSPPIPTSCARCSFPAATSARWRSTAR